MPESCLRNALSELGEALKLYESAGIFDLPKQYDPLMDSIQEAIDPDCADEQKVLQLKCAAGCGHICVIDVDRNFFLDPLQVEVLEQGNCTQV